MTDKTLARQTRAHTGIKRIEALLALCVAAVLFFCLAVGVCVYKNLSDRNTVDSNTRMGTALITNSVKMDDSIDSIGTGEGPEGPSLVLTERTDDRTFETRIYACNGSIVEEHALADAAYSPDRATKLVDSDSFSFSYQAGLLSVTTDWGEADVFLRAAVDSTSAIAASGQVG